MNKILIKRIFWQVVVGFSAIGVWHSSEEPALVLAIFPWVIGWFEYSKTIKPY